jgi:3-oxoacyl-[acyl-carrier protein] reductase
MDLKLNGKVAIVGGASKGLGRACAEELAREGAKVTICSRTKADLEKTASEIRESTRSEVFVYAGDLDKYESIKGVVAATVEHFGKLDILVANSGGPPLARAATATEEQWETAVQRSLLFFSRMARESIPHMRNQGGGRIINILASTVYQPIDNLALSGATRMGVVAFSKSLADEVGPDNILVNNVCPGSILTDRMYSNVASRANELGIPVEQSLTDRAKETAVKRIGRPDEFSGLVAFLASDRSSYITGTTMLIDGGLVRSML